MQLQNEEEIAVMKKLGEVHKQNSGLGIAIEPK